MSIKPIIEIRKVSLNLGSSKALSDITLTIEKGDYLALLGPNGSGKSTLLKLLLGLYELQQGEIKILGTPIKDFRKWDAIGYVPQKATNIDPNFPASVREIVGMGLLAGKTMPKRFTANDNQKIDQALHKVDMHRFKNRRIGELSGGQQQRVLIARAIISNPEILILDEPTSGIDTKSQNDFYEMLGEFHKQGMTIILVSHDIGRITHYVTKVASLNVKLEFFGSHEEFCMDPEHCEEDHILNLRGHIH